MACSENGFLCNMSQTQCQTDSRRHTVWAGRSSTGLRHISATESSKFARRHPVRCHRQFFLECHKARSLDRSCFSFTLLTCCSSLNDIISRLMHIQTTPRFTITVSRLTLAVLYSRCLTALTRFRRGIRQTGCS